MENNEIKTNEINNERKPYRKNNYRRRQWREKPQAISYIKSFDNFNDGFTEVIRFNPELKNYCGDFGSYDAVIASMTKAINDNIPSPNNVNYPNTLSLSIDANEVGFKTDTNIALGWRIRYSYKEAKTYYNFRVTFISVPVYKHNTITDMVAAGWKKLIKNNNRQNRYWNHIEGKDNDYQNEESDGFKIKELISDQKISTNNQMSMTKAYNEDEYDDMEESAADINEAHGTIDNTPDYNETNESAEEILEEKQPEQQEEVAEEEEVKTPQSSIAATANPNVFIIDHKGERRVINVEAEDIAYGDMLVNKETHLISFADGTIFDYKNLNIM